MAQLQSGGASPWFAFLLGAFIVAAGMIAYFVYAGAGLEVLRTVETDRLRAPPSLERPEIPDLPTPMPRAEAR